MKIIYKYPLALTGEQVLELPQAARILDIQMQGFELCAWAEIDKSMPSKERKIVLIGTGNPINYKPPQHLMYISTVQIDGMVWHFYELYNA
jgi:hypothetical protein